VKIRLRARLVGVLFVGSTNTLQKLNQTQYECRSPDWVPCGGTYSPGFNSLPSVGVHIFFSKFNGVILFVIGNVLVDNETSVHIHSGKCMCMYECLHRKHKWRGSWIAIPS
jgi:hypothetical protein